MKLSRQYRGRAVPLLWRCYRPEALGCPQQQLVLTMLTQAAASLGPGVRPTLMTRAEYVTKSLAVCHKCGGAGMYTQRVIQSDELVVLGAEGAYESRCRACYEPDEAQQERLELDS